MLLSLPRSRSLAALALFAMLLGIADRTAAQPLQRKKILTHADYDAWRSATGVTLSPDGKYLAYTVSPLDGGDAEVFVRHIPSGKDTKIARGGRPADGPAPPTPSVSGSPQFSPNSSKVVFPLSPTKAELDKAKAAKVKAEEMPKPMLAIMNLPAGEVATRLPYEKNFAVGGTGTGFLIYHKPTIPEPKSETPEAKTEPAPSPKGTRPPFTKKGGTVPETAPAPRATRTFGNPLTIRDLASGKERTLPDVGEYDLAKDGKLLVYTVASKKEETNGVFAINPASQASPISLKVGEGRYSRLTWDEKQNKLAFFYDGAGVTSDPKVAPPPRPAGTPVGTLPPLPTPEWHVYVWVRNKVTALQAELLLAKGPNEVLPAIEVLGPKPSTLKTGWALNGTTLGFNADGTRLHLATTITRPPAPTAAPASPDKVELDLWHWKDGYIQPMQKIRGDVERNRSFSAVVFLDTKEFRPGSAGVSPAPANAAGTAALPGLQFRQVSDESLTVGLPAIGDWALGSDNRKYLHLTGYADPVPRDVSVVNVKTGETKPVLTAFNGSASLSPNGKYLLTFDGKHWSTIAIADGTKTNLTSQLKVKFFDEEVDHPAEPPPYGAQGWSTDGKFVLLYDRFDLWKVAADGSTVQNLTIVGRAQQIRFRYVHVRPDDDNDEVVRGTDLSKPMLLAAENLQTRDTGFFRLEPGEAPKKLVMDARKFGLPTKAKHADTFVFTSQTFYDYPDYYTTGADFAEIKRATDINRSIREYNWGRSELVNFKSADGTPLSGVLVKPENFDPSKKYPMVVYLYERLSQNVNQFAVPNVTRGQVINPTFYASNGYLVLMPDIAYKTGYPGQSAIKCVLPAIQAVVDKGFVDENAIGINGQSWGGYQIAYMVTQTNRFKAAVAGAPVSNMVSAYNGIRWGTGLPRQFQYEKSQSRIGETLWKAPMRYIENSPIFMADRVETPLLMIHNDQDDAVPWYQGIEYFLALRRLEKECYLLNYNGEPHNLAKKANARDFAVRMFSFFEHHLKGKPAPEWMLKGVPFVDREKEKETIKGQLPAVRK